jgi:hypothetical protein
MLHVVRRILNISMLFSSLYIFFTNRFETDILLASPAKDLNRVQAALNGNPNPSRSGLESGSGSLSRNQSPLENPARDRASPVREAREALESLLKNGLRPRRTPGVGDGLSLKSPLESLGRDPSRDLVRATALVSLARAAAADLDGVRPRRIHGVALASPARAAAADLASLARAAGQEVPKLLNGLPLSGLSLSLSQKPLASPARDPRAARDPRDLASPAREARDPSRDRAATKNGLLLRRTHGGVVDGLSPSPSQSQNPPESLARAVAVAVDLASLARAADQGVPRLLNGNGMVMVTFKGYKFHCPL